MNTVYQCVQLSVNVCELIVCVCVYEREKIYNLICRHVNVYAYVHFLICVYTTCKLLKDHIHAFIYEPHTSLAS